MPKSVFYPHTPIPARWFNAINGSRLDFSGTNPNNLNDGQYLRLRSADLDWSDGTLATLSKVATPFSVHLDLKKDINGVRNPLAVYVHGGVIQVDSRSYVNVGDIQYVAYSSSKTCFWVDKQGLIKSGANYPDVPHIRVATVTTSEDKIESIRDDRPYYGFPQDPKPTEVVETVGFEVGDVKWSARANPTDGWMYSLGQSLNPTDYPELFSAIGYTYGREGVLFKLPDGRKRLLRVADGDLGSRGGNSSVTILKDNLPKIKPDITLRESPHNHTISGSFDSPPHTHIIDVNDPGHKHPHSLNFYLGGNGSRVGGSEITTHPNTPYDGILSTTTGITATAIANSVTGNFTGTTQSVSTRNYLEVNNLGEGLPVDVVNPFLSLNLFIKYKD